MNKNIDEKKKMAMTPLFHRKLRYAFCFAKHPSAHKVQPIPNTAVSNLK